MEKQQAKLNYNINKQGNVSYNCNNLGLKRISEKQFQEIKNKFFKEV
jgi:hypothetical protein